MADEMAKTRIQKKDANQPKEKKVQKKLSVQSTSRVVAPTTTSNDSNQIIYPSVVSKEVKEGDNGSIIIETKFRGTGETGVFIYVNGKQYDGGNTAKFFPEIVECDCAEDDVYISRITLRHANSQDSGNYTFLLVEKERRIIVEYELVVDFKFNKLWLTEPAVCNQLQDGTLQLKFGIRSYLKNFTTKWFHNGQQIPQSQFPKRYDHGFNNIDDENLEIYLNIKRPLLKDNAGIYYCLVQSKLNTLKATFTVDLNDQKPVIEKSPTIELEQEKDSPTLVLTVEYKSEQTVITQWRHERDGLFIDNGIDDTIFEINTKALDGPSKFLTQLRVKNYNADTNNGLYSCELENEHGLIVAEMLVK